MLDKEKNKLEPRNFIFSLPNPDRVLNSVRVQPGKYIKIDENEFQFICKKSRQIPVAGKYYSF